MFPIWDTRRLESVEAEVGALHEAMAGLHGEMGAVQRELDGAKASQDKLTKGGNKRAANYPNRPGKNWKLMVQHGFERNTDDVYNAWR